VCAPSHRFKALCKKGNMPRIEQNESFQGNANWVYQQHVFWSLGASKSVPEETECKLRNVNFRRESDPRRVFHPAFRVTGISDNGYRSTMGVVVICLGAPGTVAQPMPEFQTNSERRVGS
jgi:hypothetical protein